MWYYWFDVAGVHPKSKTPGTITQVAYDKKCMSEGNRRLGPGSYNIDVGGFNPKSVSERSSGPGWERAFETARLAKIPHLLYKEQWEKKQLQKQWLGPGTYNISDFIDDISKKPSCIRGVCETREVRFDNTKMDQVPGPGTYGNGGIPTAVVEAKESQSVSSIGMLDSGKSCGRQLPDVGSHLCPGQYEMKSFTDEMDRRMVSKRGPYDLFTGERNKPIAVGYFALPAKQTLGPGEYNLKSFLHELNEKHKKHHGAFLKVQRFPACPTNRMHCSTLSQYPREPNDPGPGSYAPQGLTKPEASVRHPFGSTADRFDRHARRFFLGSTNPVGPGRYDVDRYDEAQHANGHRSAFNSRTKRYDLIRDKYLTERIKPREVDKVFMVPVDAQ
ncbi:lymphocyte expansion molecule-like isoform X1 [Acropora millepora]|uniref:lymphocyte expansion molecule-like isoform X1 n=1 Tax=Acropora millepora TaxID=45264 RepID=UPI001CF41EB3|nr:lymphocyte expansion molecule-like isoform X1 [Acropora millepora]